MNKYILSVNEKLNLNESIGKDSVLLIKGKPAPEGRMLYVTTINGWSEIKPGLKMVFIGDTVYRVIHNGSNKFSGRKVNIMGEDGLKGVFNMKNPGRPSLVLNHNKTPFHWITLDYTDIGSALRAIGPRLFDHELILESSGITKVEANSFIIKELVNKLAGLESSIIIKNVEVISDEHVSDFYDNATQIDADEDEYNMDWIAEFKVIMNGDNLNEPYLTHFSDLGIVDSWDGGLSFMGIEADPIDITIGFTTSANVTRLYDAGDRWTPPDIDIEVQNIKTNIDILNVNPEKYQELRNKLKSHWNELQNIEKESEEYKKGLREWNQIWAEYRNLGTGTIPTIDDEEIIIDYGDSLKPANSLIDKIYSEMYPDEVVESFKQLKGDSVISKKSKYLQREDNIRKNGLTESDKKKWSNFSIEYLNSIEKTILDLIKEHKELEARDNPKAENPLTEVDIKRSKDILNQIHSLLPSNLISLEPKAFHYANRSWVESESNLKLNRLNENGILKAISEFKNALNNYDTNLIKFELRYIKLKFKKDNGLDNGSDRAIIKNLNILLNPEHRI